MKVLTGVAAAALAAALVTGGLLAGQAFAQTPTPNAGCGAALVSLTQADAAASAADAADKAAADAKKADDALADADAAVETARAAAVNGGVSSADLTAANAAALRSERDGILKIPADQRTPAQVDRLIVIEKQLPLIDAFTAAQTKAAAAKVVADKTDAEALRREADKTDTAALVVAAGKAGDAADIACGRNTGVRFENCGQVRAAGKAPLRSTDPGYRLRLDADRDGLACEAVEGTVTARRVPVPSAINTGKP